MVSLKYIVIKIKYILLMKNDRSPPPLLIFNEANNSYFQKFLSLRMNFYSSDEGAEMET